MSSKYWLKNGLINISQNAITVLFGFSSFYMLIRSLTKEDYGTWVLFLSVVSIIEMARNGLTQDAVVKYLSSADETDKKKINTATFLMNVMTTIIIITVLLIIGPWLSASWHSPEINTMLHLYIVVFFFSGILNQLNCIEQANLNFSGIFYSNIARQGIFLAYVSFCFFTRAETNVLLLTYAQIFSISIAILIAIGYTYKKIKIAKKIDWFWVKKIFHFGKYTFGVSLSSILAGSIDQMMLGSLLSKTASGSYNVAVRITNLTDIPTTAMATILYPKSAIKISKEGEQSIKYLYEKSVGVILALLLPVVILIYIFAEPVIHIIAGNRYEDSIPLLRITLFTCLLSPYGRQCGSILTSAGKTKFNFFLVVITTVLVIAFNFLFIKNFGVVGAAYGTLLATAISFAIAQFYLSKYYKINLLNPWIYAYKFYPEFYLTYIGRKKSAMV